ncbi:MAG: Nif11-like leader peptide family natural product precursor [Coleofasciculus sp. S288]|nr:Nif11-like leader peptide family natural product precursor [Coleofasciculus sp. S288]
MSVEAVAQFLERVNQDTALQQELAQAVESSAPGEDRVAAAEIGAKYGYSFTPDEIGETMEAAQKQQSGEELSEEELEAVAGGFCTPAIVVAGIGAAGAITGGVASRATW